MLLSCLLQLLPDDPPAAARLYRVALLNYLLVFPRDTIARERGTTMKALFLFITFDLLQS